MTRTLRCLTAAVLAMLPWALLHAQARSSPPALPERLAAATRASIERLCDSLDLEQLPSSALRNRAAEGVLKGADDTRILTVVRLLAARLRQSRALLGVQARDDELLACASALYTGVEPSAITRLARAQRTQTGSTSLTIPLTVVAELASQRVPMDVAVSSVEALLVRGAKDADLSAFRGAIERDIKRGSEPRDAVSSGMRATISGLNRTP